MQLFIVGSSRIAVILLQLVYIKIYTNLLSAYELGQYAFWLTVSYFFNALIFVPIDNYVQSRLYVWRNCEVSLEGAVRLNIALLLLCFALSLGVSTVTAVAYSFTAGVGVFISLAYGLTLHISNVSRNVANNLNYRGLASTFLIIDGVLKVVTIFVIKHVTIVNVFVLIASATISTFLSAVICIILMKYNGVFYEGKSEKIMAREVFSFGYPISISAILNWIQLQGYRLVLVPLGYAEAVGIYSTISSIGSAAMNAVGAIYSQLKIPEIYQSKGQSIIQYIKLALAIIIGMSFSLWVTADFIIELLTNSKLVEYSEIIVFGVLVEGGNIILGAIGIAHSLNRPTKILIAVGLMGLFSAAVGYAVILGSIDVHTIGYPLVLSQLFAALYICYAVKKDEWLHPQMR